ncbi:Uncharacterised protein [Shigella sonnei]|nr:Uncharacterised protein [Shigella sonnei]
MQCLGNHPRAGRREGMPVSNRTAKHVKFAIVHFASGMCTPQYFTSKTFTTQQLNIRQCLSCKGFVHIDQCQFAHRQTGTFQRQRC